MLLISCPSCGERGKIPANMVGARIRCKKCGGAFLVADSSRAAAMAVGAAISVQAPSSAFEGIAVEGLEPSAWSLSADPSSSSIPVVTDPDPVHPADPNVGTDSAAEPQAGPGREYKLLTSRDKIFEGKFDLSRLEDAINHYARLGWVAKSMCLPHVKNFQGAMQEEVVVLLER